MNIEKTKENENITFQLDGRLDIITAAKLQDIIIPAIDEAKSIVLDFKQLSYISSAGLRVLLSAQKAANAKNVSISVCNVSNEIMKILEMTGFTGFLTIL